MGVQLSFGAWLRERRKQLDLTQFDLAERVGCSEDTSQKIERGERRPSKQVAEYSAWPVLRRLRRASNGDVAPQLWVTAHQYQADCMHLAGTRKEIFPARDSTID